MYQMGSSPSLVDYLTPVLGATRVALLGEAKAAMELHLGGFTHISDAPKVTGGLNLGEEAVVVALF